MSPERMRTIMEGVVESSPNLLYDLIYTSGSAVGQGGGDDDNSPSSSSPAWCTCGNCREMERLEMNVCCNCQPRNCISRRVEFELLVLDRVVVQLANLHAADMFAYNLPTDNASARYGAYRQFTFWRHGRLGTGNRKVLPSCCTLKIRAKYPDPNGCYTGFLLRGGQLIWMEIVTFYLLKPGQNGYKLQTTFIYFFSYENFCILI